MVVRTCVVSVLLTNELDDVFLAHLHVQIRLCGTSSRYNTVHVPLHSPVLGFVNPILACELLLMMLAEMQIFLFRTLLAEGIRGASPGHP